LPHPQDLTLLGKRMISIPRIFEQLRNAEQAREALIADGFERDRIQLTSRQDEAGPVEGNFVVGNTKEDTVARTEFSRTLGGEGDNTYRHNFERVVDRGMYMLVVEAEEGAEAGRAAAIMTRHGGTDVDALMVPRESPAA
jgi:hypothetical protein